MTVIPFPEPPPREPWDKTPEERAEERAEWEAWKDRMRSRPLRLKCNRNTLGTAAEHILDGKVNPARIDAMIANCAWCQEHDHWRDCWHQAAKLLFEHGLSSAAPPDEPPLFDMPS